MAFEIYNGTGTGLTALAKLNEMWDFDSYDDSGSTYTATYGNVKLEATSTYMYLKTSGGATLLEVRLNGLAFKIVKAVHSIVLSWVYSNDRQVIVLGTMTDINGVTDKGAAYKSGGGYLNSYTTAAQTGINYNLSQSLNIFRSDTLTQLIPISSNKTGSFTFDNIYMIFVTSMTSTPDDTAGMYQIGNDRYYLDNCLAIKEE